MCKAKVIGCRNGLRIDLPDMCNTIDWQYFPPKIIDGNPVYRWIYCDIKGDYPEIQRYCLADGNHSYFRNTEYLIPEKEMNHFISVNGGIDIFRSVF